MSQSSLTPTPESQAAEYAPGALESWDYVEALVKSATSAQEKSGWFPDYKVERAYQAGYASGFLAGFTAGAAHERARAEGLKQELANISGWLKRMTALKWDDETYAPNFKGAHERAEQALAEYKRQRGEHG